MCGISGFLSLNVDIDEDSLHSITQRMIDTLKHRGPDDGGVWVDAAAGVALGHRRLSIQDLSAAGAQPMLSACGRFVITFNGEIYNFRELSHELQQLGHRFRGHSDTEVMLAAFSQWGIEQALQRMQGMFAFGVWDREQRTLTLVRDRAGKKPLYYGWCGNAFLFGSELKALRVHPQFDTEIDRDALGLFIQYSWMPAPYSIFKHIRTLPAGHLLKVTPQSPPRSSSPEAYWSARVVAEQGEQQPFRGSLDEAADALDIVLRDAVQGRMVADVSLGALLSGGIDSTTVVALMQSLSSRPVKTFSIGFHDPAYNEAGYAKAIAEYLGTEHTELYVTPQDALAVIPRLPILYDEPFADQSQIPTYLVSALARREVTVALSGDGGDELFAGYTHYDSCLRKWRKLGRQPLRWRRFRTKITETLGRQAWYLCKPRHLDQPGSPSKWQQFIGKGERHADLLSATDALDLFARKQTRCSHPDEFVVGAGPTTILLTDRARWARVNEPLQEMMFLDFTNFMADDILVKVDRASMAVSLEVRSPLLDQRVIEFAWRLPLSLRVGPDGGKRVLRHLLARYVPSHLTARPKAGFNTPVGDWICGPLRDWAEQLLGEQRLRQEGFLHPQAVRRVWEQHLAGWRRHEGLLWSILMFQAWRETWLS